MIHRALTFLSLVCCALIVASFALFVRDQAAGASKHQRAELAAGPAAVSAGARRRAQPESVRHVIDASAHALSSPFGALVSSRNAWLQRGVPTVVALIAYGVGLTFVARLLPRRL